MSQSLLTSAATSVNEDENSGGLGGFDDVFKLPVSRGRHFELGRNYWHRFEEAQQKTALDRVIDILQQRQKCDE